MNILQQQPALSPPNWQEKAPYKVHQQSQENQHHNIPRLDSPVHQPLHQLDDLAKRKSPFCFLKLLVEGEFGSYSAVLGKQLLSCN